MKTISESTSPRNEVPLAILQDMAPIQNNSPSMNPYLSASKNIANAIPSSESLEMYKRLERLERFEQQQ
jgi:hypothetical protein